ncbi:hypothetical protein Trydic_g12795 [Trypoxylus dichotomus]
MLRGEKQNTFIAFSPRLHCSSSRSSSGTNASLRLCPDMTSAFTVSGLKELKPGNLREYLKIVGETNINNLTYVAGYVIPMQYNFDQPNQVNIKDHTYRAGV